jgi:F420-dependent oxidoreductase-like protein
MDLALMIEGQAGLNWPRWQRMAQAAEDLGFAGLYRSDHFTNANPPDQDSLEMWISLAWLASHTQRIQFGPLVSPVSFRNPVMTARMAAAVDDLSGGRLQLGLGAGWQTREHANYGFDLLDVPSRMARFEEGVEVITRLLRSDTPVAYSGMYYHLHEAILLPRPQRPGGPPIIIGGGRLVLPLVVRYAQEWNVTFKTPDRFAVLNAKLDDLLAKQGRPAAEVRRSLMTRPIYAPDAAALQTRVAGFNKPVEDLKASGYLVGTGPDLVEQLGRLAEAGVQRVMLQWLDLDDLDTVEAFAQDVVSHFPAAG